MRHSQNISRIILAYTALLKEKDPYKISVTNVTDKANISRTTFYKYFDNVDDLMSKALQNTFDHITSIFNRNLLLDGPELVEMLAYLRDNKHIYQIWVSYYPNIDQIVRDYIRKIVLNSDINNLPETLFQGYGVHEMYAFDIYIMTIQTIIFTWLKRGCYESPEEIAQTIDNAVLI